MVGWIWSAQELGGHGDAPWGGVNVLLLMSVCGGGLATGKAPQAKARPRSTKKAKKGSWKTGG